MELNGLTEAKLWQDRIMNGLRFQQKIGRSNEWARYKAYYRHEFASNTLPVNLMFSVLRALTPQIVLRNPKVTATTRRSGLEAEIFARILQKLDNWLLYELMTKRELKKLVSDCFFAGTASGFVGYDSQFGYNSELSDPTGQFSMTQFDKKGDRIEMNTGVNPGMPWFLRARPEDVVFPWGATDAASLDWVAMRVFRRVSDLQRDKKYSNTADLTGDIAPVRTMPEGGQQVDVQNNAVVSPDPEARWVELWQVHDARSGKVLGLTMNSTNLLRKDVDEMQIEGLPVETVTFNPDPDYIYGIPDARIIEPQLLELIDIRTQAQAHRRVDVIKSLVKKGTITAEEIQKLKSGDVNAFVSIETEGSIRDSVLPLSPGVAGILNDLNAMGAVVQGDVREMVGFSRILMGEFQGKTHVSASETDAVMQSLNIRLDERRDAMADLLAKVVRKFNQYIFTYWTADRVESIIGPDGAKWWVKFNGPQIKDEYDIIIEPEEGRSLDTASKRAQFIEAAKIWAEMNQGAIKQGIPVPAEIQRALFGQFDDLGLDIDRLLAQNAAGNKAAMASMMGAGASPENPATVGQLVAAQGGA